MLICLFFYVMIDASSRSRKPIYVPSPPPPKQFINFQPEIGQGSGQGTDFSVDPYSNNNLNQDASYSSNPDTNTNLGQGSSSGYVPVADDSNLVQHTRSSIDLSFRSFSSSDSSGTDTFH